MEENLDLQPATDGNDQSASALDWLVLAAKSFIFPCFSPAFYKEASKKSLMGGIAFFFLFAFVITFVPTIQVTLTMRDVGGEIRGAYERGEFPTITIEDGIAEVDGEGFVFEDNRSIVAIDTTGGMTEIDTRAYSQGILLTRTELHFVNEDGYQEFPLSELNRELGNPIVLDKTQVLDLWNTFSIWIVIFAFFGILIWHSVFRLAYIALIGLVIWGIVSLIKSGVGYGPVLITGILANVPVVYLKFILKQVNFSFFTLYSILLIIFWSLALWWVLRDTDVEEIDNPPIAE